MARQTDGHCHLETESVQWADAVKNSVCVRPNFHWIGQMGQFRHRVAMSNFATLWLTRQTYGHCNLETESVQWADAVKNSLCVKPTFHCIGWMGQFSHRVAMYDFPKNHGHGGCWISWHVQIEAMIHTKNYISWIMCPLSCVTDK